MESFYRTIYAAGKFRLVGLSPNGLYTVILGTYWLKHIRHESDVVTGNEIFFERRKKESVKLLQENLPLLVGRWFVDGAIASHRS